MRDQHTSGGGAQGAWVEGVTARRVCRVSMLHCCCRQGHDLVSTGSIRKESGAPWLAGEMVHVNCRLNKVADQNVDNTPEWLSDANIAAFMAEVDAPAALVG